MPTASAKATSTMTSRSTSRIGERRRRFTG
jgi:hypothetical protein